MYFSRIFTGVIYLRHIAGNGPGCKSSRRLTQHVLLASQMLASYIFFTQDRTPALAERFRCLAEDFDADRHKIAVQVH